MKFFIDFFLKISPLKYDELVMSDMQKIGGGVTDFVLERINMPGGTPKLNLSKSGFVREEDHSVCKPQNIAI